MKQYQTVHRTPQVVKYKRTACPVYAAEMILTFGDKVFAAKSIGYSSPEGSYGNITEDTSLPTTALHIIKNIMIYIQ